MRRFSETSRRIRTRQRHTAAAEANRRTHTVVADATAGTQASSVDHTVVPIPTSTYAFPVRLKATIAATPAPSIDTAAVKATVTIVGTDINGNTLTNVLTWTASTIAASASLETLDYYDPTVNDNRRFKGIRCRGSGCDRGRRLENDYLHTQQ